MSGTVIQKTVIGDSEPIFRILFCPSMVVDGCVSPTAFELDDLERGPETYISLFLISIFPPTKENCINFRARRAGDSLYGYATSFINKCKDIAYDGISLLFKMHDKSTAGHIGMHYSKDGRYIKDKCLDPSFLIMTKLIARQFQAIKFQA